MPQGNMKKFGKAPDNKVRTRTEYLYLSETAAPAPASLAGLKSN